MLVWSAMSSHRAEAEVSRKYRYVPDYCVRALALLLKKQVTKEDGPSTALEDARKDQDARTNSHCT